MANFLVSHPHCFNLSDMGTMKTLSTLWAADWLMRQYPEGQCRAIIVAPLSILERVWGRTIFENFLSRRTFKIVHGSAEKRTRLLAEPADFYVINFDGLGLGASQHGKMVLSGLSAEIKNRADIRIAVIDEASAYRSSRTRRHKVARQLLADRDYLWLLTGTPTPNGPFDAFGLAKLVNNAHGESFTSFYMRTMQKLSMWKWVPKPGAHHEVRKLLHPAIRYDIKDVWDGPELTTQQRHVDLTPDQTQHLRELKRKLQAELANGVTITPANEAALRMKLIQISLGAVYDAKHDSHKIDCGPRVAELGLNRLDVQTYELGNRGKRSPQHLEIDAQNRDPRTHRGRTQPARQKICSVDGVAVAVLKEQIVGADTLDGHPFAHFICEFRREVNEPSRARLGFFNAPPPIEKSPS